MQVCGQTLILVDSDSTVSEVNQKIIKSTLKYMMYHAPKDRAFCISTYGHKLDKEEEYTTDVNDLVCSAELIEFEPKDSNLTDVLCDVLSSWKESDFACRDIVVFTDGLEGVATEYEDEELYYLIDNTSYQIYVVDLVQEGNASAKKHLSAISTTSGGKLYYSEYEGDDAGVDKHLSDSIYAKMDEWASSEWKKYEVGNGQVEEVEAVEEEAPEVINDNEGEEAIIAEANENEDDLLDNQSETIIYEDDDTPFYESTTGVIAILGIVFGLIIGGVALGLVSLKRRKLDAREDEEIKEIVRSNTSPQSMFADDGFTTILNFSDEEGTKLLFDTSHRIELLDEDNSDNARLLCVDTPLCVGRSASICDLAIEDDSVSKRHCEFLYQSGTYYVRDLDSSNGTYLNDERIDEAKIKSGDRIKIGRSTYRVRCYE